MQADLIDRLQLLRTERIGPVTYHTLVERFGTAGRALEALPHITRALPSGKPLKIPSVSQIKREMDQTWELGAYFVTISDLIYPKGLKPLHDRPPILVMQGDPHLLQKPIFSMVGSRRASANGIKFARSLAQNLGKHGWVIASGMALGIDRAAHEGTMQTGTVGVLANGIDVIYPPEHEDLFQSMIQSGLLVTEMPFASAPNARAFPRRNRIISGLALGTLVVEASLGSGSLITAQYAIDQGREVFATPGSPTDPRSSGCNRLIREGAHLVERAEDILSVLDYLQNTSTDSVHEHTPLGKKASPTDGVLGTANLGSVGLMEHDLDEVRRHVTGLLTTEATSFDDLVAASPFPSFLLRHAVVELEVSGILIREPGDRLIRVAAD